ncbi:MAG: hypothetical protein L3J54_00215 [Draconibacterium sp.]|nr:hypothetical protein [Draconibacterium sp.]
MENWATEIKNTIDTKLKGTRDKEIRFYRIDEFKRNITRVDSFSKSCPFCQQQKIYVAEVVDKIDEAVHVPGQTRREYDRLISKLSKHIQKEHGFYTPYYFAYIYSFFGIVGGLILGYVLTKINHEFRIEMLSVGFIVGLIPTYVWGSIKDKKVRSEKRLM